MQLLLNKAIKAIKDKIKYNDDKCEFSIHNHIMKLL